MKDKKDNDEMINSLYETVEKAKKYDNLVKDTFPGKKHLHCSFCGKREDDVRKLVAGPGVYICSECIEICAEAVEILPPEPTMLTEEDYSHRTGDGAYYKCPNCGDINIRKGYKYCSHCGCKISFLEDVRKK